MATLAGHAKAAPVAWTRAAKLGLFGLAVVALGVGAFMVIAMSTYPGATGLDFHIYLARTHDWLSGAGFYRDRQLHGPYPVAHGDATYPPVLLYLTVPFALGVPEFLWWVIPITITAVSLVRLRPAWWGWILLAFVLGLYYRSWYVVLFGNPCLWAFAALTAGMAWGWSGALVLFKLTLVPFAFIGMNRRRWWVGLAFGVAIALPFLSMWPDFLAAIRDARQTESYGPTYLLGEWPIAATLVVVAWSSRLGARLAARGSVPSRLTPSAPASD